MIYTKDSYTSTDKGFTLIEVIIAILIFAIMVGFFISRTGEGALRRGEIARISDVVYKVSRGIYDYVNDTGSYPGRLEDLIIDNGTTGWRGPYIPYSVSGNTITVGKSSFSYMPNFSGNTTCGNIASRPAIILRNGREYLDILRNYLADFCLAVSRNDLLIVMGR